MFKYLFCFFLVFSISSNFLGQTNKYYLLPDSIDLKQLLPEDKVLLDSSMKVYYSAKKESAKLATLKKLAESLTDEEIWPYYNQKIYEMVRDKKDSISVVHKIGAINNIGFINYNKGNIDEALKWFEQSLVLSREFK